MEEYTNSCMRRFHGERFGLNSPIIETLAYKLLVLRSSHRETVSYKTGREEYYSKTMLAVLNKTHKIYDICGKEK